MSDIDSIGETNSKVNSRTASWQIRRSRRVFSSPVTNGTYHETSDFTEPLANDTIQLSIQEVFHMRKTILVVFAAMLMLFAATAAVADRTPAAQTELLEALDFSFTIPMGYSSV